MPYSRSHSDFTAARLLVVFIILLAGLMSPRLAGAQAPDPTAPLETEGSDQPEPQLWEAAVPLQVAQVPPLYLPFISSAPMMPTPPETRLYCAAIDGTTQIPDNNSNGITLSLHVDDTRPIVDLDVYLRVNHDWVGDLGAAVSHIQTGRSVWFLDRPGLPGISNDGCDGHNITAIFDDEANLSAEDRCGGWSPALSGTFLPAQDLAAFEGESMAGEWTLTIADYGDLVSGALAGYCLEATVAEVPAAPVPSPDFGSLPESAFLTHAILGADQRLNLDCESRSAVDWAGYFGYSIGEYDFFYGLPVSANPDLGFVGSVNGAWGHIPPNDYGVHLGPIATRLNQYGVPAVARKDVSWDAVRAEIAADRPVEVLLAGWYKGSRVAAYAPVYFTAEGLTTVVSRYEHSAVVIGYSQNEVYLLDGSAQVWMNLEEFLAAWSALRSQALFRN